MSKEKLKCISCKRNIANMESTTRFNCPNCSKSEIIRCPNCREIAAKYTCSQCQFEGPN